MKRIFISTVLAFVAGILVTGGILIFCMRLIFDRQESVHAAASASMFLAALYPLRAGNTNAAVSRLETMLDGQILVLRTMPQSEIVTATLGDVKKYRIKYPYSSGDKGFDAATQKIMSGVEEK